MHTPTGCRFWEETWEPAMYGREQKGAVTSLSGARSEQRPRSRESSGCPAARSVTGSKDGGSSTGTWIGGGAIPPRPPVPCKMDAFRPIIDTRLAEFPRLTATRTFR